MIACHECDRLHAVRPIASGSKAFCTRCGSFLYQHTPNSLDRALALHLTALMLFILANSFPFISLKLSGRLEQNVLLSGALALYRLGMGEVGVLVFVTSFLFPLASIAGFLTILVPLRLGSRPAYLPIVYRLVRSLTPWSLLAVFMLGALIAIVKLLDLATVIPGVSLFAFAALMVAITAANANLDTSVIWPFRHPESTGSRTGETAMERGLVACHSCSFLLSAARLDAHGHGICPRCEASVHLRKQNSLARTWALICTATILLIPANVYPVMTVVYFGQGEPNTILSGVIHLIEGGMWGLALIIFFASIVIPVLKLVVLSYLLISTQNRSSWRPRDRTLLFRVTESIGAWSMVDIYVVAILVGIVNLDALATIRPGIGATFFGSVVVITMLAAHSFDPRFIWDNRTVDAFIKNGNQPPRRKGH